MAAIDWRDLTHQHRVTVQMVSQTNLDDVWGTLEGVDLSASSIDAGYYTDTRTSGKLKVYGEGWIRGSFLRVVHEVPDFNYHNVLGTYIVTDDDSGRGEGGIWSYDLELHSTLMGLANDRLVRPWSIAKGASAVTCIKQVLTASGMHSMRKALATFDGVREAKVEVDSSLADDVRATTAQVMKAGSTRLECLYALASMSKNRVDVTPHGTIKLTKFISPSARSPKFRIDIADERGIAEAGSLRRSTDWLSMPDTAAVEHSYSKETTDGEGKKHSEQTTIYGIARVPASTHQAVANRGYSIVSFTSLPELATKTAKAANDRAAQILKESMLQLVEWELTCCYIPVWEGDVVELRVLDGDASYRGVRKCLVKNVSISLDTMMMRLTLRETASGDREE